jgi:tRNA threonylcarbamoyladenosine biosynthesis protein TsaE
MTDKTIVAKGIGEDSLVAIAEQLSRTVDGGGVIYLIGPLGAGKTTFARALLTSLGVGSRVKSPTYSLIESYIVGTLGIQHIDLYRIADPEEIEWLGLRDFAEPQLWLIEWPERAAGEIPAPDLIVNLAHAGPGRDLQLIAKTPKADKWVESLGNVGDTAA